MEFWGVEVPSGRPVSCDPGDSSYIHVSQAALGGVEKSNERVVLKVKTDDKEIVIGTLSAGKCDQITLDLIFEKEFSISHNGSSSVSVHFAGYRTDATKEDQFFSDDEFSDEEEEADIPTPVRLPSKENGKLKKADVAGKDTPKPPANTISDKPGESKSKVKVGDSKAKAKLSDAKAKVDEKANAKAKADDGTSDEDEDDDEFDDDDDDDEDEDMLSSGSDDDLGSDESDDDEDDDDESGEDSEEEQQAMAGKKRQSSSSQEVPIGKKNKVGTPQGEAKPGKKELKTITPVPPSKQQQQSAKKDKKTPGKDNPATPNSGKKVGQYPCAPCNKNFTTESALSQHKAAKHK